MKTILISIGNELLNGRTVNSNATFIGGRLYEIGVITRKIITVRDEAGEIVDALRHSLKVAEVVILTGGLGPTHDDITKTTVADYFHSPLVLNEGILKKVEERFRQRGLEMPAVNRNQAMLPEKAIPLENSVGTAPGLYFRQDDRHIFVLPGVPREMKFLIDHSVIPILREGNLPGKVEVHYYRTTGITESKLYEICREFFEGYPGYEIAFLPKFTGVDMRVAFREAEAAEAPDYGDFEKTLYEKIGKYIYAKGYQELEEILGDLLRERQLTIAVAESCTGGLVQSRITGIAGSSDYFMGGMVTYSNESKIKFLDVREEDLNRHGAVSEVVAKQMATGIRLQMGTDIGLSTTGIAGPGGANPGKPLGLLYIGLAIREKVRAKKLLLGNDRLINQERGAQAALELVRRELLDIQL